MHPISKTALAVVVVSAVASCSVPTAGHGTAAVDVVAGFGECIQLVEHSTADFDVATIDCAEPEALYEVALALPGKDARCPNDEYSRYLPTGDEYTLCLMLNAAEGDCFDGLFVNVEDTDEEATGPVRADCAAGGAKVTKVITGVAAEGDGEVDGACPAGTSVSKAYPEPPPGRTVCLKAL